MRKMVKKHCYNCIAYHLCEEGFDSVSMRFPVKKCKFHEFKHDIKIGMAMDFIFNNNDKNLEDWF